MTLVTSTEWVLLIALVGIVWSINQYVISSGLLARVMRSAGDTTIMDDPNTTVDVSQRLALTYDIIYRPITVAYFESEELRTWIWLILALLLNVICISIELSLFEYLTDDVDDKG